MQGQSTTNIGDALDRDFAQAWRPSPGDKLVGEVVEISSREGAYGEYPIVTLRTDTGDWAIHAFHEVLGNELARVAPKIGDRIGVKYSGKDPEKGYHRYRVRRDSDNSGFDWQKFATGDVPTDVPAEPLTVPTQSSSVVDGDGEEIPFRALEPREWHEVKGTRRA
jgi:hypothetical protein